MAPHGLFVLTENGTPVSYTHTRENAQRAILKLGSKKAATLKTKWIDAYIHSLDEANIVEVRYKKLGTLWNSAEYTETVYKIVACESFKHDDGICDDLMEKIKEAQRILQESIKEDEEDITKKSERLINDANKLLEESSKLLPH